MTGVRGMDIEEYSDRSMAIGKGLKDLCGDLYSAMEDKIALSEVDNLIAAGEEKIQLFNKLLSETTNELHDEVITSYGRGIDKIRNYSEQLKKIYHV